ncbi:hypothetical protein SCHPADRAFT_897007 [Schizopora paradoxa]|uniref:Uncharacterized protein n=1 Tax=Schizopora paradoxa TaxID=27342 RepID=A0A0H2QYM6_9AGAM|nr:hypothetical protein SCHPADRAFT_897007 [Schizopora paradoxa]
MVKKIWLVPAAPVPSLPWPNQGGRDLARAQLSRETRKDGSQGEPESLNTRQGKARVRNEFKVTICIGMKAGDSGAGRRKESIERGISKICTCYGRWRPQARYRTTELDGVNGRWSEGLAYLWFGNEAAARPVKNLVYGRCPAGPVLAGRLAEHRGPKKVKTNGNGAWANRAGGIQYGISTGTWDQTGTWTWAEGEARYARLGSALCSAVEAR